MTWYSYQTFRLLSHVKQIWFENYYLISQSQKKQDTNTLYSGLLESKYLKQMFTLKEYFFFYFSSVCFMIVCLISLMSLKKQTNTTD